MDKTTDELFALVLNGRMIYDDRSETLALVVDEPQWPSWSAIVRAAAQLFPDDEDQLVARIMAGWTWQSGGGQPAVASETGL